MILQFVRIPSVWRSSRFGLKYNYSDILDKHKQHAFDECIIKNSK